MGFLDRLLAVSAPNAIAQPDRRASPRVAVALTGRLSTGGDDDEVSVINLSDGGALIETTVAFRVGERSVLSIERWGSVPVVVRWVAGRRIGVAFDR